MINSLEKRKLCTGARTAETAALISILQTITTNKHRSLPDIMPFYNAKPDSHPVILELLLIIAAIMTVAATETQHCKMSMRLTMTASPLTRFVCSLLCCSKTSIFFSFSE